MKRWLLLVAALVWPAAIHAQDADRDFVVGVQDIRNTLDPAMALANAGFPLTNAVFDTLLRRDFSSDGQGTGVALRPGLAESWQRIDDRTVELTLRASLAFHNGEELTSDDVKFTFDRILDPDSKYGSARFQLSNIESIETPDPLTVRVITKEPDPMLEQLLAYPGSAVVPKDYFNEVGFEAFGQKPVGAGPYSLLSFVDNDHVRLEAFPDYWAGRAPASRLTFREIPEVSARITALANGEVALVNSLPPDQLSAVSGLECCEVRSVMTNSHVLNYRTSNSTMADPRFRRGLNLAINRALLAEALWQDKASVPRGHQYPEWAELYDEERSLLTYDPEVAKRLIAESGYAGQKIEFVTHPVYYTNGLAAAQAVVEMWRDVGVNAEVRVDENWYATSNNDPDIEVRNLSDWLIVPDPHATIFWSWTVTSLWDDNDAFRKLGEQAGTTLDRERRRALYKEMLDLLEQEAPGTVLYRVPEFYGVRSDVAWQPYSVYMMDFRKENLAFQ